MYWLNKYPSVLLLRAFFATSQAEQADLPASQPTIQLLVSIVCHKVITAEKLSYIGLKAFHHNMEFPQAGRMGSPDD